MKKILSMALVCSMLFSIMSMGASANTIITERNAAGDSLSTASFSTFFDVDGYDYVEVVTLGNGDIITFKHFTSANGRSAVEVTETNGVVTLVEFDPDTFNIYLDGEKVDGVTTYADAGVSPAATPVGWHESSSSPIIQNYEMINFTIATLAGVISAFTTGPVSAIFTIVEAIYSTTNWCSAKKWMYLNYTDYTYRVASYNHSKVYDKANATGNMVYEYTSPIVIR